LLLATQWRQSKRAAAADARRRHRERTRRTADQRDLLERLDDERRVYARTAFDAWLRGRSLTAAPDVVDRLDRRSRGDVKVSN